MDKEDIFQQYARSATSQANLHRFRADQYDKLAELLRGFRSNEFYPEVLRDAGRALLAIANGRKLGDFSQPLECLFDEGLANA